LCGTTGITVFCIVLYRLAGYISNEGLLEKSITSRSVSKFQVPKGTAQQDRLPWSM
jgi:hypothetical protein